VKISNKKFSFFSSLNQYFPHIPYVASEKPDALVGACKLSTHCKLVCNAIFFPEKSENEDLKPLFQKELQNFSSVAYDQTNFLTLFQENFENIIKLQSKFPKSNMQISDGSTCKPCLLFIHT
jgi:hypothetical protein